MDVTNMIQEYSLLRNRVIAGYLDPDSVGRIELLKQAIIMAEKRLIKSNNRIGEGDIRIRFYDGDSLWEIRLNELTDPVLDIELSSGVTEGYKIVVVEKKGGPASAVRAQILGQSDNGPSWYRVDLGQDIR
ncbi:MAG: hypothetical protein JRJ87_25975 [Deltaproteobacteria bacterium]|nr:hypothetical protein [Deltaproteobacteria bacterium]